jgi:hypothetical protein
MKESLVEILRGESQRRVLYLCGYESQPGERSYALLSMTTYKDGNITTEALAESEGHARWIEWLSA